MSCPQCQGVDRVFSRRYAEHDLATLERRGLDRPTRVLVEALIAEGVTGATLLDVGGGVGAIQYALLEAGAASAVDVDASHAFLEVAREEANRRGYADRIRYHFGDMVTLAPQLAVADIVTLDRVLCCYDDLADLVRASVGKAGRLYGLVYPRDTWWMRFGGWFLNAAMWIQRNSYRFFVHADADIAALLREAGLQRVFYRRVGVWQVMVYRRP